MLARTLAAPARQAERKLGAADAQLGASAGKIMRTPKATGKAAPLDFASLLPKGTRIVPSPTSKPIVIGRDGDTVTLSDPDAPSLPGASGHVLIRGQSSAVLVSADPNEPMHRQAAVVTAGRAPRTPSRGARHRSRWRSGSDSAIGSKIESESGPLTVTGISRSPFCLSCDQVVALPDPDEHAAVGADPAPGRHRQGRAVAHASRRSTSACSRARAAAASRRTATRCAPPRW